MRISTARSARQLTRVAARFFGAEGAGDAELSGSLGEGLKDE
jgi:hypothetical protein